MYEHTYRLIPIPTQKPQREEIKMKPIYFLIYRSENIMAKIDIAHDDDFFLLPQCFEKLSAGVKGLKFIIKFNNKGKPKTSTRPYVL